MKGNDKNLKLYISGKKKKDSTPKTRKREKLNDFEANNRKALRRKTS